ncbi:MAG: formate dehydrogenase accessory protein FdhE [Acidobacteriota bacterium]|nr:formate dehydrogenase accessory protein FdhE [Acidobacteriota bacterium]
MTTVPAAKTSAAAKEFDRRAFRAAALVVDSPAAAGPLEFARGLYSVQGLAAAAIEAAHLRNPLTGHLDRDLPSIFDALRPVQTFSAESGPPALSAEARNRIEDDDATARTRLMVYWNDDAVPSEDYLSRATLRPYVETLRLILLAPARVHKRGRCPFCGAPPAVASRRDGSTLEGARRLLGCVLCGSEWTFPRILCPSCFEEEPTRLPNFETDRYPHIRIEACETCHRYLKSHDLSLDARPIPEVDDLASLSLDLWAVEQGFTRIEPGLAGL